MKEKLPVNQGDFCIILNSPILENNGKVVTAIYSMKGLAGFYDKDYWRIDRYIKKAETEVQFPKHIKEITYCSEKYLYVFGYDMDYENKRKKVISDKRWGFPV